MVLELSLHGTAIMAAIRDAPATNAMAEGKLLELFDTSNV